MRLPVPKYENKREYHLKLQYQFIKPENRRTERGKYSRTWEQFELNATFFFVFLFLKKKKGIKTNLGKLIFYKKQVHPQESDLPPRQS